MIKYCLLLVLIFFCASCTDNITEPVDDNELIVSLRMEVHVVDSLYHLYSRPHTKTYFYTFKKTVAQKIVGEEYSDTTTCPNGWAVKELLYRIRKGDSIYLGATTWSGDNKKYFFQEVNYTDIKNISEGRDTVRYIKTFSIYE